MFSFGKNPRQITEIATIFAAKRQRLRKFLKIKFKPLKELEKGTPDIDVTSLFGETKNTLSTWKKRKSSNRMKMVLTLKE